MPKEIKCQYCGNKYTVINAHDCCPKCGAFNEFELNNSNNLKGNSNKFKLMIPILGIVLIITFSTIGGTLKSLNSNGHNPKYDLNYNNDYTYDNYKDNVETSSGKSTKKEIDWDKGSLVLNGNPKEMIEFWNSLDKRQKDRITAVASINSKLDVNGSTLYLDNIKYSIYGDGIGTSYVDVYLETKNLSGKTPSEIDIYLVGDGVKDRITEDKDSFCYIYDEENPRELIDLLKREYQGETDWEMSTNGFHIYDTLKVVIDNEEIDIPLEYENSCIELKYYDYK